MTDETVEEVQKLTLGQNLHLKEVVKLQENIKPENTLYSTRGATNVQCEQLFKAVYEKVLDKTSQPYYYKAVTNIYTFIINKFKQLCIVLL